MFKRRTVGPAFERSPLEQLTEWGYRNMLFLFAVIVGIIVWLFLVIWMFDSLLPGIQSDGTGGAVEIEESSNGPIAVAVKLVGSVIIAWFFHKQSTKR